MADSSRAAAPGPQRTQHAADRPAVTHATQQSSPDDPLWYKDAVIYELLVKSFHDSDGDGIGDFKGLTGKLGNVRNTGSIAYEMALVASGVFQYAAFGGPKIWDVAAGVLIIREAGGEVLLRTCSLRHWEPLRSFLQPGAGIPKNGDMREWNAGLLVGNAPLVEYVASNLRRRSRPFRWLRRAGRLLSARARARGRHAEAPEGGKQDVSGAPPSDSEGSPPPQKPE